MRYVHLLFSLLLIGCDFLWVPPCSDDPSAAGCQLAYRAIPDYAVAQTKQSWQLAAVNANLDQSLDFNAYQSYISVTPKYTKQDGELPEKMNIWDIDNSGNINVEDICATMNCPQKTIDTNPSFTIKFGNGNPLAVPLRGVDLGCAVATGPALMSDGSTTSWVGLRSAYKQATFSLSTPAELGRLKINNYNLAGPLPAGPLISSFEPTCQATVTKNFSVKSQIETDVVRAGVYILDNFSLANPCLLSDANPDSKQIYCPKTKISQVVAASGEDFLAVAESQSLTVIKLTKDSKLIIHYEQVLNVSSAAAPKVISFADVNFDGLADLIFYREDKSLFVYRQQSDQSFVFDVESTNLLKSAMDRVDRFDPQPVGALVAADFFQSGALQLVLAKGTNLWLVALDPELNSPSPPGVQPAGTALLENPFAEPPDRLEAGDLNGDGLPDLVYVSKSAAHFCLTRVVGQ